jgi:hypothetical protein
MDPAGAEVHPRSTDKPWAEQVEILVGLRAPTAGEFGMTGFRVDYSLGGRTYAAIFKQAVALCAPASALSSAGCVH